MPLFRTSANTTCFNCHSEANMEFWILQRSDKPFDPKIICMDCMETINVMEGKKLWDRLCLVCSKPNPDMEGQMTDGTPFYIHEKCAMTTEQIEAIMKLREKFKNAPESEH